MQHDTFSGLLFFFFTATELREFNSFSTLSQPLHLKLLKLFFWFVRQFRMVQACFEPHHRFCQLGCKS